MNAPRMRWGVESAVGCLQAPRGAVVCLTSSIDNIGKS